MLGVVVGIAGDVWSGGGEWSRDVVEQVVEVGWDELLAGMVQENV